MGWRHSIPFFGGIFMKTSLNRAFFWLITVFYFVAYYYQTPIQLSYILTFEVSGSALGIISSLSSFISVLVIPIVPALTRRFGKKPVFLFGFFLQIVFFGLYWFAANIQSLEGKAVFAINVVNGLCSLCYII